ncbi:enolase superfamily enzyme related to L-alanine-DL-glutamate epimerase [Xenococcus sp. PCC 7305]|uniref:o-succinylbenzoate synthase n=1 Tax=Xenococcus sp. PCC 7305 TaxID=102125 RepID=UPI0002AC3EBC|nr:o-succinylbenzoate synthase [Xenococcus sp. PCC 7305]ELS02484.1 enolase superfamily enzyme related to L-alanine-DL-glutamate epimerase [Xenococcus sp. PCC 7305]
MKNISADWIKHTLKFSRPSGTSRGVLLEKPTWYILLKDSITGQLKGIGECSPIPGLSIDNLIEIEEKLDEVCAEISAGTFSLTANLKNFPCLKFGLEMAFQDLEHNQAGILYPSTFTKGQQGIYINGLIWMGDLDFMRSQIREKLANNCSCLKVKIGALDFQQECSLIAELRSHFNRNVLEIRVDANGAFAPDEALEKLNILAQYDLHSIEQPIKPHQWQVMAELCRKSPIPIALDEELIGIMGKKSKENLLSTINPQYIVLKPSLLGGFSKTQEWIDLAEEKSISWWITSALESNIGLNAIAQWTATLNTTMPQGLGTGHIYSNNIRSPLKLEGNKLYYDNNRDWEYSSFFPQQN